MSPTRRRSARRASPPSANSGFSVAPEGLAEPDRHPRYPQRFVEVMARNRPLGPGREVPIDSVDELRVGPATAREVGWLK